MGPEGHKRARELFDAALEMPRADRNAFLKESCATDLALHDQVQRLLRHAEDDGAGPDDESRTDRPPAPHGESERGRDGTLASIATVGAPAPEFDLPCASLQDPPRTRITLPDCRGRWLVLVFYPRDFSLICPTELTALRARIDEFRECGAEILAVSVDSIETHDRWLKTPKAQGGLAGLRFPLASDPDGRISRAYGVYLESLHVSLRGLFIIDPNGVIQYSVIHNLSVGRRTDDLLRVLSALQTGGLCAEDWTPALATLDPAREMRPGSRLSHYRIEECIGHGSCGCVFRARDTSLERTVALKVICPSTLLSAGAVLDEARAAAALNHINICTVYAVDDSEGIPFIAMEYVEGRSLRALLEEAPLPLAQVACIGQQIAAGMASAHAIGLSHGDLKPGNVIVRNDGVVKILDFGLARLAEQTFDPEATVRQGALRTGGVRGTPAYMSPEQACGGRPTSASDVFSLGVILYELLTGDEAFGGQTIPQVLSQVRAVEPERFAAAVSDPFAGLFRRALTADAKDRALTMQEFAHILESVTD